MGAWEEVEEEEYGWTTLWWGNGQGEQEEEPVDPHLLIREYHKEIKIKTKNINFMEL